MATAKHRAIDQLRRSKLLERKHEELGRELEAAAGDGRAGSRRRPRRRHRRRPAAPRVHRLPSGALHRGARRAHAAPARRPDDRGDRARVPRPGADRRPAHRPRQADARRGARPLRGPARRRAAPPGCRRCSRSSTSSSTRATRRPPATTGCGRRSARTRCASAASWPSSRREEPEVHGLVALMEIQASRSRRASARRASPILLLDQNRARWDQLLIRRGLAALARAEALGGARGPYALQAAIAACHARARTAGGDGLGAHRGALRRARRSSRRRPSSS